MHIAHSHRKPDQASFSVGTNSPSHAPSRPKRSGYSAYAGNLATQAMALNVRRAAAANHLSMPFPHRKKIQRACGVDLELTSVRDEVGCLARNTVAFTEGRVTHFASGTPDL